MHKLWTVNFIAKRSCPEVHSEMCQTSKMEPFAKTLNGI